MVTAYEEQGVLTPCEVADGILFYWGMLKDSPKCIVLEFPGITSQPIKVYDFELDLVILGIQVPSCIVGML